MDERPRPDFFRRAIRRRWRVVLVALLVGLTAIPAYLATATTEYRATSVVFLEPLVGNPYSPTTPTGRQEQLAALTTEAGLLLTDSVVRSVEEAGRAAGVELGQRLHERIFTEVPSNSQVVNVSFTAATPEAAQFGAQALATAYLDYRQTRSEQVATAQTARLDQEISSLSALVDTASNELETAQESDTAAAAAEVLRLEEQLRMYANQSGQLRIERVNVESASTSPGEIVTPAQAPSQPEGLPAPLVATAVVLTLLGCGLVAAVVLEHLDTRVSSTDEIERLGVTPAYGVAPLWRPELRGTPAEDSYRLATLSSQRGIHGLLGAPGTVPVEVAAGLAQTFVEMGHSVIVVFARPSPLPADGQAGVSDALSHVEAPARIETRKFGSGVRVMSAGTASDDLPRLVHRPSFSALVLELAAQYDVVMLVGGSAWSSSGAAISRASDRVVLVATAGETREEELLAAARMVKQSNTQLGGVLLTQHRRGRRLGQKPSATLDELLNHVPARDQDSPSTDRSTDEAPHPVVATAQRNGGS